jgi:predicted transcriptional regulator
MSARAAWRLEGLGFTQVHRYAAGKMDWLASGLPRDGRMAGFPTAGDALRRDVPSCRPDERVGDAAGRARAARWDMCVVANEQRIVLGVLRKKAFTGDPSRTAEAAMESGPTTFRPNELLAEVALHLVQAGVKRVLVTTGDGELLGALDRAEALRRTGAADPPARGR